MKTPLKGMKTTRPDIQGRGYPAAKETKHHDFKNVGVYKSKSGETKDLF
jgi:hypothetical protein